MTAPIIFAVIVVAFLLFGLLPLGLGVQQARAALGACRWPTVSGTIAELEFLEGEGDEPTYGVRVRYAYEVNGRAYEGDRLGFGIGTDNRRDGPKWRIAPWPRLGP